MFHTPHSSAVAAVVSTVSQYVDPPVTGTPVALKARTSAQQVPKVGSFLALYVASRPPGTPPPSVYRFKVTPIVPVT